MDQYTDTNFSVFQSLIKEYPNLSSYVKTASITGTPEELPTSYFADRSNRLFPLHTPEHVALSKAYATKLGSLADGVMREIDDALLLHGVPPEVFETTKVASNTVEPEYLIESQKKFPLTESTSIKEAEEALQRNHKKLSVKSLTSASNKLIKHARARGENVSDWTLKYSGLVQSDTLKARDWIEARANKAPNQQLEDSYYKLASIVENLDPSMNRDNLIKVANTLESLDTMSNFKPLYGKVLPDPVATIFNTKTAMQPTVDLGGKTIPMELLASKDPSFYGDILGEDIVDEISDGDSVDPRVLVEILDTLPLDMKMVLLEELGF